MPRPKNKKPSPELAAIMELLTALAKEDALLVWDGSHVRTVKKVRFGHDSERVPKAIIFNV